MFIFPIIPKHSVEDEHFPRLSHGCVYFDARVDFRPWELNLSKEFICKSDCFKFKPSKNWTIKELG